MTAERIATAPSADGGAESLASVLGDIAPSLPHHVDADSRGNDTGLAQLVLTLIELIRQLLEHQAVRRMEGGSLSEAEIERLGLALMRLEERLGEIRETFGLAEEDLNIDLGPLGKLI